MYLSMIEQIAARGFLQYEISNFAKTGYESRHNLKYWNTEEYLGFGPAAHSDFGGARFSNAADIKKYLSGESVEDTREVLTDADRLEEYVMLQMRLAKGLDLPLLSDRFGAAAGERFSDALGQYEASGLILRDGERLAFTPRGMLVSNSILSDVLCFHR
jgi:oxygen-independent coproporphyrinogen-3 oxidase